MGTILIKIFATALALGGVVGDVANSWIGTGQDVSAIEGRGDALFTVNTARGGAGIVEFWLCANGSDLHGPPSTKAEERDFYKRIGGGPVAIARGPVARTDDEGSRPKSAATVAGKTAPSARNFSSRLIQHRRPPMMPPQPQRPIVEPRRARPLPQQAARAQEFGS
jgi:hypothetical protein